PRARRPDVRGRSPGPGLDLGARPRAARVTGGVRGDDGARSQRRDQAGIPRGHLEIRGAAPPARGQRRAPRHDRGDVRVRGVERAAFAAGRGRQPGGDRAGAEPEQAVPDRGPHRAAAQARPGRPVHRAPRPIDRSRGRPGGGYRPQSRKLSSFVMEALNLPAPPKSLVSPSGVEGIARFAPGAEPQAAELAPMPPDVPLKLSKDQIDDFLTCPLKYRYAHVVKIPLGRDPRAMFGSAVHHAIKIYHQHRRRGLPITLDDVLGAFEGAWSSEGFYTREHEELRLEEGRVMLRRFFEREERSGLVPLAVEAEFAFTQGHDHVTGRFDRIDERQGEIVIVDYKTAEVEAADRAEQRAAKSLKEDQLGLYALAY